MEKGKYKILITDDENGILDLLENALTDIDERFDVTLAHSGYEALSMIRERHVDVLLTDIAMPDMDGFELYERAKELKPDIHVIMMTGFGYDPNHTVVNAKKAGLNDIIFKPFEIDKLLSMLYDKLK